MNLISKIRLGFALRRVAAGKPTTHDKHTMTQLILPWAAAAIRHGLTTFAGFLAARGLPGLTDGTIENLTEVGIAAALFVIGIGWSFIEKKLREPKASS